MSLELGVTLRLLTAEELTELLAVDEALDRIDDVTVDVFVGRAVRVCVVDVLDDALFDAEAVADIDNRDEGEVDLLRRAELDTLGDTETDVVTDGDFVRRGLGVADSGALAVRDAHDREPVALCEGDL